MKGQWERSGVSGPDPRTHTPWCAAGVEQWDLWGRGRGWQAEPGFVSLARVFGADGS